MNFIAEANNNNFYWSALPGYFSPDISIIKPSLFNVQYSSNTVSVFTDSLPNYNVDIKVVVTAGE